MEQLPIAHLPPGTCLPNPSCIEYVRTLGYTCTSGYMPVDVTRNSPILLAGVDKHAPFEYVRSPCRFRSLSPCGRLQPSSRSLPVLASPRPRGRLFSFSYIPSCPISIRLRPHPKPLPNPYLKPHAYLASRIAVVVVLNRGRTNSTSGPAPGPILFLTKCRILGLGSRLLPPSLPLLPTYVARPVRLAAVRVGYAATTVSPHRRASRRDGHDDNGKERRPHAYVDYIRNAPPVLSGFGVSLGSHVWANGSGTFRWPKGDSPTSPSAALSVVRSLCRQPPRLVEIPASKGVEYLSLVTV
ncbi:hypothetical protein GGS23DRAFT_546477 [Durotheca rogersii]|uniref:uncharacterized protein n=1 Tax=Durotheca rogersii TaxID=419775 RepID=UPI00221F4307|nr:uncharacterized protein GGS23DRAFT_546477 [Durotheca rogersii]KAI5868634.1 hypothetical protein GGS23DRAFT_546477 [Durotheca rogersii]